jgi:hypothetical protein
MGQNFGRKTKKGPKKFGEAGKLWGRIFAYLPKRAPKGSNFLNFVFI